MKKILDKIRVGSRASPLAKAQMNIFLKALLDKFGEKIENKIEVRFYKTSGDKFLNKNISEIGNKGLFTKEIDEAQLRAEIDIGVHSLKDLPTNLPEGLIIAAVLPRGDCRDVIYSKNYKNLNNLKKKAIIGTSSIRRAIQLKHLRPDLVVKEIRGNVETRIKKIKDGKYDAIILAAAGLKRLGIKKNFFEIDTKKIVPAIGQGVIAIVADKKNKKIINILREINDEDTFVESECEREYLKALDGSCQTPIGGMARIKNVKGKKHFFFRYMASSLDGKNFVKNKTYFKMSEFRFESLNLGKKIRKKIGLGKL